MQDALSTQLGTKTEAVQLLNEVAQTAAAGGEKGAVSRQMRERIAKLDNQWNSIGAEIEAKKKQIYHLSLTNEHLLLDIWTTHSPTGVAFVL